jgi:hypothetical protein
LILNPQNPKKNPSFSLIFRSFSAQCSYEKTPNLDKKNRIGYKNTDSNLRTLICEPIIPIINRIPSKTDPNEICPFRAISVEILPHGRVPSSEILCIYLRYFAVFWAVFADFDGFGAVLRRFFLAVFGILEVGLCYYWCFFGGVLGLIWVFFFFFFFFFLCVFFGMTRKKFKNRLNGVIFI